MSSGDPSNAGEGSDEDPLDELLLAALPDPRGLSDVAGRTPALANVAVGSLLGEFRLIRPVGRGGQGEVWEAEQVSLRRRVALKVLHRGSVDTRRLERFAREARAGARLTHPCIVTFYAFGTHNEVPYIAQELVPGGRTLRSWVDSDDPPCIADAIRVARALSEALAAAHEAGVLHRDVKPQNVLIDGTGQPKLTDFGLARLLDETRLSKTGDVVGTYLYMSPEQLEGRGRAVDHRTDVFSLGVLLYELIARRHPFDGETSSEVLLRIANHDPPDPDRVRNDVPRSLALVCSKMIRKRPADRYASMREVADELRRVAEERPVLARPASPLLRGVRRAWSRPGARVAIGALVILAVGTAIGWRARNSNLLDPLTPTWSRGGDIGEVPPDSNRRTRPQPGGDASAVYGRAEYQRALQGAGLAVLQGNFSRAMRTLDAVPEENRDWAWQALQDSFGDSTLNLLQGIGYVGAFSPDNRFLAAEDTEAGCVSLWDLEERRIVSVLPRSEYVADIDFDPSGREIYVCGTDGQLTIWAPEEQGEPIALDLFAPSEEMAGEFSPDGSRFFCFTPEGAVVRDPEGGKVARIGRLAQGDAGRIGHAVWLEDHLLLGTYGGEVWSWNGTEADVPTVLFSVGARIQRLAESGDGSSLAVLTRDHALRVVDVSSGQTRLDHDPSLGNPPLWGMEFCGSKLFGVADKALLTWDLAQADLQPTELRYRGNSVEPAALLAGPESIVVGAWSESDAAGPVRFYVGRFHVWLAASQGLTHSVAAPEIDESLWSFNSEDWSFISEDGRLLGAFGVSGAIHVYDLDRPPRSSTVDLSWPWAVSPRGNVAVQAEGSELALVSTRTSEVLVRRVTKRAAELQFDPTGRLLAANHRVGREVTVLEADTLEPRYVLEDGLLGLNGLVFTPDGEQLVWLNRDGGCALMDAESGARVCRFELQGSWDESRVATAVSPDGGVAAVWDSDDIHLLDLSAGSHHTIRAGSQLSSGPRELDFDPSGQLLAACTRNTVRVWRIRDASLLWESPTFGSGLRSVRFAAESDRLLVAEEDGMVWELDREENVRRKLDDGLSGSVGQVLLVPGTSHFLTIDHPSLGAAVWLWDSEGALCSLPFDWEVKGRPILVGNVLVLPRERGCRLIRLGPDGS